jgi:hypothetical protein
MEDQLSVSGKVFKLINETGVTKADKAWEKQTVVIETEGQYPTKIAVSFMGEKVLPVAKSLKEGEVVKLHINVSSQSPDQVRWFNNINGWKIDRKTVEATSNVSVTEAAVGDLPF